MVLRRTLFTGARRVRFLRMGLSFGAVALLSGGACPTSPGGSGCGQFVALNIQYGSVAEAVFSPDLITTFSGGVRTFSWSRVIENVCTDEHVKAEWRLTSFANRLPPGFAVEAGYLITAGVGRVIPLEETTLDLFRHYDGKSDIGLKQAFEGKTGRFLIFFDISFTSRGDIKEDQEALQRLFQDLTMFLNFNQAVTT